MDIGKSIGTKDNHPSICRQFKVVILCLYRFIG